MEAVDPLLPLDVIYNPKEVEGEKVVQLETAMGAALKYYSSSLCISVPRTRFRPVKNQIDLEYLQSPRFRLTETYEIEEVE